MMPDIAPTGLKMFFILHAFPEAQRGGAAKESQKAKGKTQKSKVKGRTSKTHGEQANGGGTLM
jgi:hypothetical protein